MSDAEGGGGTCGGYPGRMTWHCWVEDGRREQRRRKGRRDSYGRRCIDDASLHIRTAFNRFELLGRNGTVLI